MTSKQMADILAEILAVDTEKDMIKDIAVDGDIVSFSMNNEKFDIKISKK